jgi:hypothetical protein
MMRRVATGRHIRDCNQCTERIVIQGIGGEEVLVLVVTSSSPEVADLLGPDLRVDLMWRAVQGWGRHLKNRY